MTSTASDAAQQKFWQILTLPASRAAAVSIFDEEALPTIGESRGTAIWISDDDAETEDDDDDDEGQDFDDSQLCIIRTTASIADHWGKFFIL